MSKESEERDLELIAVFQRLDEREVEIRRLRKICDEAMERWRVLMDEAIQIGWDIAQGKRIDVARSIV